MHCMATTQVMKSIKDIEQHLAMLRGDPSPSGEKAATDDTKEKNGNETAELTDDLDGTLEK